MKNVLNSVAAGVLLSLFTMNAHSQGLKTKSPVKSNNNKELFQKSHASRFSNSQTTRLKKEQENILIPNFKHMYDLVEARHINMQFDGKERILNSKSGSIWFDRKVMSNRGSSVGCLFKSHFNEKHFAENAKTIERTKTPQIYSGSIYFKKGFVHQIDKGKHGGATFSAPSNAEFKAEEDGRTFQQINLEKLVEMAIASDGFEIALSFNADEDGSEIRYTTEYLENNKHIRDILTDLLGEDGANIKFEGESANKVLTDYRRYIVKEEIEKIAREQLSSSYEGSELDRAVETFMKEKYNANAQTRSNGSEYASEEVHNQIERSGDIVLREIPQMEKALTFGTSSANKGPKTHHCKNHTHIGYFMNCITDENKQPVYKTILGPTADKDIKIIAESSEKRSKLWSQWSEEEAQNNVVDIRIKGNVTNLNIDDVTVLFLEDGSITSQYNEVEDRIDVALNGKALAKVTWEDAKEKIDPSRILIGQINHDGVGFAEKANNISDELSYSRRAMAGLNPVTDILDDMTWLSTQCKTLYLAADKNDDEYASLLKDFEIEEKIDNLAARLNDQLGIDMKDYVDEFRLQYTDPTSDKYFPAAVMNEHLIAYEIAKNYSELGIDFSNSKETVLDNLSSFSQKTKDIQISANRTITP